MLDGPMSEYEAKQALADAGVPTVTEERAESADEAVEYAEEIGYPVLLKVDSVDVQHKTDIGAVQTAHDADAVRKQYQRIMENVDDHVPDADVSGVLVEEQLDGQELIVGVHRDADFGHVIMFGLGGIFVEVLEDVHFRSVPITRYDAEQLIDDMATGALLDGVRGDEPVDKDAIVDVLLAVSDFIAEHPEVVELDINPLFANAERAVAADALLTVDTND